MATKTKASSTSTDEAKKLRAELKWLKDNPEFEQRPATLSEFLGPDYLNIEARVRKSIRRELDAIYGDTIDPKRIARYPEAMITGGIGIGKTTVASIVLPYMAHWVLCLKDPQGFYGLLPGSRIAFMQMSTSEKQALEVVFGDIKARIEHSKWFVENYPMNPKYTNQIRFDKDIWIIPGDSAETTFEGYNILGGILDEMDSHKITPQRGDYADLGYDTISNRIKSRFQDRGFFLLIGQMKKSIGFAARKYEEFKKRDDAYVVRMAIWDSMGDEFYADADGVTHKFAYDTKRKQIISDELADIVESDHVIRIPELYRQEFEVNPEKALRDLAGIPPVVGDPFISLTHTIEDARDRWLARYNDGNRKPGPDGIFSPVDINGRLEPWFYAKDSLKRVGHIDMAFSGEGDALGFAMGHVSGVIDIDGEQKPNIVIDLLLRLKAPAGGEILLQSIRHFIYALRDERKFRLKRVTMDGFQSTDTRQQLTRRRFESAIVSVDKDLTPYYDLRDALYENRIEFPQYVTHLQPGSTERVEIVAKELASLVDAGKKIDHPDTGSKDVADAVAGVVFTLMGDRSYRRKVVSLEDFRSQKQAGLKAANGGLWHPAYTGGSGMSAPPAPTWSTQR